MIAFRSKSTKILTFVSLITVMVLAACTPGAPTPTVETPTLPPPTSQPEATTPPTVPPTAEPTAQPTTPPVQPVFGGFMLLANREFTALDFSGQPLGFKAPSGTVENIIEGSAGVTKNSVVMATNTGLLMVKTDGISPLPFVGPGNVTGASNSRDGSKIAWVTEQTIDNSGQISLQVELWVANMDGSNAVKAAELTPVQTAAAPSSFSVIEWTADGRLVYATRAVGIGGYILFGGYTNLYLFDPANGKSIELFVNDGSTAMCVNSISADLSQVAVGCKTIQVQTLATGAKVDLPAVTDQTVAGSAQFSPSGAQIAYGAGRANPDSEFGQVVVAPVDGSNAPRVIASFEGGYYQVLGWLDENTLILRLFPITAGTSGVWKINIDGSGLTKLADGVFVGFIY